MAKTIIAPSIAFIFLVIKLTTGIDVDASVQAQVVDVLATGAALSTVLYGIFKNHKKET